LSYEPAAVKYLRAQADFFRTSSSPALLGVPLRSPRSIGGFGDG
jgi:hypothetical protein